MSKIIKSRAEIESETILKVLERLRAIRNDDEGLAALENELEAWNESLTTSRPQ